MSDNKEILRKELNLIENETLRRFVEYCLDDAPEYFYHVPASSSGKYHPKQDLGEGGLIRHTKAVVQVAIDLIRCEQFNMAKEEKDNIISACILHDVIKNGFEDSQHTVTNHPLLASEFIENRYKEFKNICEKSNSTWIKKNYIRSLIETHMGIWNKDKEGNEVLPLIGDCQPCHLLVHLADYIASRKYIDMSQLEDTTHE